jgi:hypothetical protein
MILISGDPIDPKANEKAFGACLKEMGSRMGLTQEKLAELSELVGGHRASRRVGDRPCAGLSCPRARGRRSIAQVWRLRVVRAAASE